MSALNILTVYFYVHSLEVGSCIAVQVCMIQIPLLILFNSFYVSAQFLSLKNAMVLLQIFKVGVVLELWCFPVILVIWYNLVI